MDSYPTKSSNDKVSEGVVYGKERGEVGASKYEQTGISDAGMPTGVKAPPKK